MPDIGIFWYDPEQDRLFGIYSLPASQVPFDTTGKRVFPHLHQDVWDVEHAKCFDRYGDLLAEHEDDPFRFDDYTLIPRGRVFEDEYGFFVNVGRWLYEYDADKIKEMVRQAFDLPEDTDFEYDYHWDIGNGWGE